MMKAKPLIKDVRMREHTLEKLIVYCIAFSPIDIECADKITVNCLCCCAHREIFVTGSLITSMLLTAPYTSKIARNASSSV